MVRRIATNRFGKSKTITADAAFWYVYPKRLERFKLVYRKTIISACHLRRREDAT